MTLGQFAVGALAFMVALGFGISIVWLYEEFDSWCVLPLLFISAYIAVSATYILHVFGKV